MKPKKVQASRFVRFVVSSFCLTASLVPLTSYGADTGTVRGRIIDKSDGEGVYGASVTIAGTTIGTATDMNGNFVLQNVPAKSQKISVSIVGYAPTTQTVTVGTGETASVSLQLGQTTIMASEVIVGASLYKQDRLDVPVTVNVVSKEEIKQVPNPTLDTVVENVPGVVVNRAGGYGTSTIQIRGSNTYNGGGIGTRIQGLYDGFPINTPTTGEIVWTNISMNAADRVEILKGSAATLYGSGAMGGVMNVYGRMPETLEVKAGVSVGFYDAPPSSDQSLYRINYTPWLWNTYVGFGNKTNDWNYNLLYSHSNDDGFRKNNQTKLDDVKLKARYNINANQYIQLTSFYSQTEGGYPTTWPYTTSGYDATGPMLAANLAHRYDAETYNASYGDIKADDIIKRKNALAGFNYVNLLSDKLTLDAKIYYTRNESRVEYNPTSLINQVNTSRTYNRYPGEFNEDITDRIGTGLKTDWKWNDQNRLLFGVEGNVSYIKSTQYTGNVPTAHPLTDAALHPIEEKSYAFFLQNEYKPTQKLTVLASLRYDWNGIDANQVTYEDASIYNTTTYITKDIQHKSVDALNPRIALNFKAQDDLSFRASWGKSFRAPTLCERFVTDAGLWKGIPNPGLDKESMTAYEVGVFKQFNDRVTLDIAAYINNYNNLIESRFLNSSDLFDTNGPYVDGGLAPVPYFTYSNLNNARIWGIETGLNIKPTNDIALNFGYSYMNAKNLSYVPGANPSFDKNPDPTWLPIRPEHTASAGITWHANKNISLNSNARYVGSYKAVCALTDDKNAYPGDFVVINASAKIKIEESATVSLVCKNIGNVQYSEAEWFPAVGRSFVAGVDFTF